MGHFAIYSNPALRSPSRMWSTAAGSFLYSRRKLPSTKARLALSSLSSASAVRAARPERGEAGDDVTQTRRPVAIERPGPPPDFDGLGVVAELIMCAGK